MAYSSVLSILRLAHKYGNAELQHKALLHFATTLPTNLAALDALDANKSLFTPRRAERFRAVDVISEVGEIWLLPMAFFRVIHMCTVEKIYMGVPSTEDGGEIVRMSQPNQLSCLQAYVKNIKAVREILQFLAPLPVKRPPACLNRDLCNTARHKFLDKVEQRSRENETWGRNPLNLWPHFVKAFNKSVCVFCAKSCEEQYDQAREKYWSELPRMFGVPHSWEELEKMKEVALKGGSFSPFPFDRTHATSSAPT